MADKEGNGYLVLPSEIGGGREEEWRNQRTDPREDPGLIQTSHEGLVMDLYVSGLSLSIK